MRSLLLSILIIFTSLFILSCDKDDDTQEELKEFVKCMGCKKIDRPQGTKIVKK